MHRKKTFIYTLLAATLASIAATLLLLAQAPAQSTAGGLTVVATFPSLAPDIEQLLCPGDKLYTVAPPGVDPHEYQLKPSDMARLREAAVIVSTGHAPFEAQIRRLVEDGELHATLLEIPSIPGVRLLTNPATHQPNLHMPIYDPENYKAYIRSLTAALSAANPACSSHYRAAAAALIQRVDELQTAAPRLGLHAAATTPLAQYAVTWLNISIDYLLLREHGLPPSPDDVAAIEEAAASHRIQLVVIVEAGEPTPLNTKAEEIARSHGLPVLRVPSPLAQQTIPDKLSEILRQARELKG